MASDVGYGFRRVCMTAVHQMPAVSSAPPPAGLRSSANSQLSLDVLTLALASDNAALPAAHKPPPVHTEHSTSLKHFSIDSAAVPLSTSPPSSVWALTVRCDMLLRFCTARIPA